MAKHRTKQYSNKVRTLGCSISGSEILDGEQTAHASWKIP
ncbi:hypothetical protein ACIPIK_12750 [Serratia liquefaciens]